MGPSVGGWLSETFGWRAIFAALPPILIVAFILGCFSIRQSHAVADEHFDLPGWTALAGAFAALVFAVDEGANVGWTSPVILVLFAAFVVLLALFITRERRCAEPLIHLSIFDHHGYVLGLGVIAFLQFTILGLSFLLPNYAQLAMGAGQTEAGSVLLWGCVLGAALAPVSGQLLDRLGARVPVLTGAALALAACVGFTLLAPRMTTMCAILVYVVFAGGQSLMYGNDMTCALSFLPVEVKADGNAMFTTLQQLSGAIGTSVCAAIVNAAQAGTADGTAQMAAATAAGTQQACALLIGMMAISFACAVAETSRTGHWGRK